jgi:hypothetical protein
MVLAQLHAVGSANDQVSGLAGSGYLGIVLKAVENAGLSTLDGWDSATTSIICRSTAQNKRLAPKVK